MALPNATNVTRLNTREYDRTVAKYLAQTKKDRSEVLNRHGYFIALNAFNLTPFVAPEQIKAELGANAAHELVKGKRGKWLKSKKQIKSFFSKPLLALIINARRGRKGEPGLYGYAMLSRMRRVLAARIFSSRYLGVGFLPAIRAFGAAIGKARPLTGKALKEKGVPKGGFVLAKPGTRSTAKIINSVAEQGKRAGKHADAVKRYVVSALQDAFNKEVRGMKSAMEKKHRESARRLGIRTR